MNSGIYKITCTANGRYYYGRTVNFEKRKRRHFIDLKNSKHCNIFVQRVYDKYGAESISIELIIPMENDQTAQKEVEQKIISESFKDPLCMNISEHSEGGSGKHTEEAKLKMRGRKFSEEHKQKLSEARQGKYLGSDNVNALGVLQIDLKTMEVVNSFDSIAEACRFLEVANKGNISAVCKGTRKNAYGYYWKYKELS